MLSKTKLKKEIESMKEVLEKIEKTKKQCEDGIELNSFVLEAFKAELAR